MRSTRVPIVAQSAPFVEPPRIDSPHGGRPWLPWRGDSPSRKGFDGYLIANSIGGAP
jgi:hypothetical protein